MNSKVTTYFIPLTHNTEFTAETNEIYGKMSRLDSFLVKSQLSGNVTITTINNGETNQSNLSNANIYSEMTLPASAFTPGTVYNIRLKKVSYANASDQIDPKFIGLL